MSRLRWPTAGESHGLARVAALEGLPVGVPITTEMVADHLARRRLGFGRGARMKFERDEVTFLGGVWHGLSPGSPVAVRVGDTEWPKWEQVMAADPETLKDLARNAPLTRPRPGHADLAGMQEHGFDDARPVLERALARETAARVALGAIARSYLKETVGIAIVSHVVELCSVKALQGVYPTPADVEKLDADPLRCLNADAPEAMVAEADQAHKDGDTLGGVIEVLAHGAPVGLGSHGHWDRELNARLAGALMAIQAIKGVEIGDGFERARVPGSQAHDEIVNTSEGIHRVCGRAGGTDGGLTTGELPCVRAAMRPLATVPRAPRTADVATGEAAHAHHQRSDVTAVPAADSIAEAMVALVLADAVRETVWPRPAATCSPASTICRSGERAGGPPRRAEWAGKPTAGELLAERLECAFWGCRRGHRGRAGPDHRGPFRHPERGALVGAGEGGRCHRAHGARGGLRPGRRRGPRCRHRCASGGATDCPSADGHEEEAKCTGLNAARPRPAVHPQQQRLFKPPSTHGR